MEIRELRASDYIGFKELCDVFGGMDLSEEDFAKIVKKRNESNIKTFVGVVVDDIVATHTIIIETKFIHSGGNVAHFEDLIVHPQYREHGLGQKMLENSLNYVKEQNCYKAIYKCSTERVKYYERTLNGYVHEVSMRTDL